MRGLPLRSSIRLSFRTITVADSVRSRQVVHPVGDARARRGAAVDWRAVSPARRARCDLSKSLHIYCSKKSRRHRAAPQLRFCQLAGLLCCPSNGNRIDKRETRFTGSVALLATEPAVDASRAYLVTIKKGCLYRNSHDFRHWL